MAWRIGVVLLLAGCASSTGVFVAGDQTYGIATRATWELGGRVGAIKAATAEASEHCSKMSKSLVIVDASGDYSHFEGGTHNMRFRCQ